MKVAVLLAPFASLLTVGLAAGQTPAPAPRSTGDGSAVAAAQATAVLGPLVVDRGTDLTPLLLPRDEELSYRVRIDLGLVETPVGVVTMSGGVDPYKRSVLLRKKNEPAQGETGWMKVHAAGDYTLYSMDATIETRIMPQSWPRLSYRYVHQGTENRRREILLGERDGKRMSSYRKDTRTGAPKGTRIWRKPEFREVPPGTVDMLSAIYLVRTMVRDGLPVLRFPMIDKRRIWQMKLRRGRSKTMKTRAGTFDVVQMLLEPSLFPGELEDKKKKEKFEGLFGIHGSIQLWVEKNTGIPVKIQGDLPVGPLTLGIEVELRSYKGTPAEFRALPE